MSWNNPDWLPNLPSDTASGYDWKEAPVCMACDGSGKEADSGEGWWEQSPCRRCKGSGDEPEFETEDA